METCSSSSVPLRYGDQAGRVSDDGLAAAGNTVDLVSVSNKQLIIYIYLFIFILDLLELEDMGNTVHY